MDILRKESPDLLCRPCLIARRPAIRYTLATFGLMACLAGLWITWRAGQARYLSAHVIGRSDALVRADRAIALSPLDPNTHYARADILYLAKQLPEAIKEYEHAVDLRPSHYYLWMRLGYAREMNHDNEGSCTAYREAARLAPNFAQPHRYLGLCLLRLGLRDEAFAELRRAGARDPYLMLKLVHDAWDTYGGNLESVEQAVQPQSRQAHLELAYLFLEHGHTSKAMEHFEAVGDVSERGRREFLAELLKFKQFNEAYKVWSHGRDVGEGPGSIINGGFENPIPLDDTGFGWQISHDLKDLHVYSDSSEMQAGARSLRLDFDGNSDPTTRLVSQLVLVKPNTQYRLNFAARTQDLASIGLPMIFVTDASNDGQLLAHSDPLPAGTRAWQDYTVSFSTSTSTSAVLINIRRQDCANNSCQIFGHAWLDSFSLQKL